MLGAGGFRRRRRLAGLNAGLKHAGRMSSRFAVGRDVEASGLGWEKTGNVRMSLSFCSSVQPQWLITVVRRRQRGTFFV